MLPPILATNSGTINWSPRILRISRKFLEIISRRCRLSLSKKVLTSWWTGKQAPPPLPPHQSPLKIKDFSGAEPARERFFLWKMGFSGAKIAPCPPYTPLGTIESSKGLRPSRALRGFFDSLPENPKGFQPSCHPLQSPLKIEDFSGAEPARKRFFLWKMGFSDAKTVPCPRCIFALPFLWKSGSKWSRALPGRKGCGPLELSWVF